MLYVITHLIHPVSNAPVWDYALDWKKKQNIMVSGKKITDLIKNVREMVPDICVVVLTFFWHYKRSD